jgi:uncharacterized small protein (DUF1192 family)
MKAANIQSRFGEAMLQSVSMVNIDQKIAALEERLARLKQRHRKSETRRRTQETRRSRLDEARRRDLVGAVVLARVEIGKVEEQILRRWMDEGLMDLQDRELFGLS